MRAYERLISMTVKNVLYSRLFIDTSDVVHLPADQRHQLVKSSTDDKTLVMKQVTLIIRGGEEGRIVEELRHYYDRVPGMSLGPDELYCVIKRQETTDMNQILGSLTEDPSTRRADDNQQNQRATPGLHSCGGWKHSRTEFIMILQICIFIHTILAMPCLVSK